MEIPRGPFLKPSDSDPDHCKKFSVKDIDDSYIDENKNNQPLLSTRG